LILTIISYFVGIINMINMIADCLVCVFIEELFIIDLSCYCSYSYSIIIIITFYCIFFLLIALG
jgi:hypothetical protein